MSYSSLNHPSSAKVFPESPATAHVDPPLTGRRSGKESVFNTFMQKSDEIVEETSFEKGKETKFYFRRLLYVDTASVIISTMGLVLSVIQDDLDYTGEEREINDILLWIIFSSTLVLIFFTSVRYKMKMDLMKAQKVISKKINFWNSGLLLPFLVELSIILPCPVPFLTGYSFKLANYANDEKLYLNYNLVLSLLILLRIIMIGRVLLNITIYCNYRSSRICRMYGCNANYFYSLRCVMKNSPTIFIATTLIGSIFYFGHALRICERVFSELEGQKMKFGYYYNSFWAIILTMTTVGYGDYFPQTIPGRCIIFIVCIWGVFILSMTVVTLTNKLELNSMEAKALTVIMRLEKRNKMRSEASLVLTIMGNIGILNRKRGILEEIRSKKLEILKDKLRIHLNIFRQLHRELKTMFEGSSLSEDMNNGFDLVKMKFYDLREKQKEIKDLQKRISEKLNM